MSAPSPTLESIHPNNDVVVAARSTTDLAASSRRSATAVRLAQLAVALMATRHLTVASTPAHNRGRSFFVTGHT